MNDSVATQSEQSETDTSERLLSVTEFKHARRKQGRLEKKSFGEIYASFREGDPVVCKSKTPIPSLDEDGKPNWSAVDFDAYPRLQFPGALKDNSRKSGVTEILHHSALVYDLDKLTQEAAGRALQNIMARGWTAFAHTTWSNVGGDETSLRVWINLSRNITDKEYCQLFPFVEDILFEGTEANRDSSNSDRGRGFFAQCCQPGAEEHYHAFGLSQDLPNALNDAGAGVPLEVDELLAAAKREGTPPIVRRSEACPRRMFAETRETSSKEQSAVAELLIPGWVLGSGRRLKTLHISGALLLQGWSPGAIEDMWNLVWTEAPGVTSANLRDWESNLRSTVRAFERGGDLSAWGYLVDEGIFNDDEIEALREASGDPLLKIRKWGARIAERANARLQQRQESAELAAAEYEDYEITFTAQKLSKHYAEAMKGPTSAEAASKFAGYFSHWLKVTDYKLRNRVEIVLCCNSGAKALPWDDAPKMTLREFSHWLGSSLGLDPSAVERLARAKPKSHLPEVLILPDHAKTNDMALDALGKEPDVYQRDSELVQVRGGRAVPFTEDTLRERLSSIAVWHRGTQIDPKTGMIKPPTPESPPAEHVREILKRGYYPEEIRKLRGITDMPVLREDGTIASQAGYDPQSGYLLTREVELFPFESVDQALDVLRTPFEEFTFNSDLGPWVAVGMVLTACCRSAWEGPSPLFAVDAHMRGTGKTLLQSVVTAIGFDEEADNCSGLITYPKSDEELGKLLNSRLYEGAKVILLDNAERTIGGAELASKLTSTKVQSRILGKTQTFEVENRALWLVNGNQIQIGADMRRRIIYCPLTCDTEHPENREFNRKDLLGYVREYRDLIYAAALHVVGEFIRQSRPEQVTLGSFGGWASTIASALYWATGADITASRHDLAEDADLQTSEDADLVLALIRMGATSKTSALKPNEILERLSGGDYELFERAACRPGEHLNPQRLGYRLRKLAGVATRWGQLVRQQNKSAKYLHYVRITEGVEIPEPEKSDSDAWLN